MKVTPKTKKELLFYAIVFEVIALSVVTPLAAYFMDKPLEQMGTLTVICCLVAMAWNMTFNAGFERVEKKLGLKRTFGMRVVHITLFEIGLLSLVIPFGAYWLNISLLESLLFNFAVVAFFLPYGFIFNLTFDKVRAYLQNKRLYHEEKAVQFLNTSL